MKNYNLCIVGLGYVGLPLAVAFAEKYKTIGFDINQNRVEELKNLIDSTKEIDSDSLKNIIKTESEKEWENNKGLFPTSDVKKIQNCNVYIITVPTPIDKNNRPDLTPLVKASQTVGGILKKGDLVIYESTVYPGVTEDECVPILEECSNLRLNLDFYVGYSPERINPGDKEHTVTKIKKVTSGSSPESSIEIDNLYKSIITAGTHLAPSIKVAEAAKVIENSQRDINIAFVNELSKIFNLLNLDTSEILEAAATKWNFLKFQPGLVGGHCIGVDPFYLSQKAQEVGYHPEIILAGRRINDSMGQFVATETIRLLINRNFKIKGAKILILGFTFKENCPDYRNTKVIDIHDELIKFSADVSIYEPEVSLENLNKDYNCRFIDFQNIELYDAIILAVPHKRFKKINWRNIINKNGVLYDVKSMLSKENSDGRL